MIKAAISVCFDIFLIVLFNIPNLKWFVLQPLKQVGSLLCCL